MTLRKYFALAFVAFLCGQVSAQAPAGYYDSCKNRGGASLLSALCEKIGPHTTVSYSGLWTMYRDTDTRPNGTIWDMYSTKEWTYAKEQCGSYSSVGSCYNREHSMPKSWFSDASPMVSDGFHIYPTDGKVNGQRSNYPFGECANGTTLSAPNGIKALGRLGSSTYPGYSGTVFEPDDQYKGDFARTYFYMAAAYNDRISSWKSDMLARNSYPVFSSWAINMLLEWHRQDPVSEKETARNNAVYNYQKNRNPFIDHPELAEYIWGDKKDQKWDGQGGGATTSGEIVLPVDGSTIDMGVAGTGVPVSTTFTVRGKDLTGAVSISATNALQLSATTVSASQANAGYEVTATWKFSKAGSYRSVMTLTSGSAKSTVTVTARVQDGLPATAATEITSESFRANWTYVGDDTDGKYTLDVKQGSASIDGYPRQVDAAAGHYTVDGLEANTAYSYTLRSANHTSNTVSVTTGQLLPFIDFLYEGVLALACEPGAPSAPEEILVDTENISTSIAISVDAPFQISTDRTDWATTLTLQPAEDRFYIRLAAERAGTFTTEITGRAGDYVAESGTITGTCTAPGAEFIETFEENSAKTYTDGEYQGSAAKWLFSNVGVVGGKSQGDRIHAGEKSCRFGKSATSSIEMLEDKAGGAGTISFYACRWQNTEGKNDPAASLEVEVSSDGGNSWKHIGTADVSNTDYRQFTFTANVAGNVRVRIAQSEGSRLHLDDVAVSNYGQSGIHDAEADSYYGWDAFSPAAGTLRVLTDRDIIADVHGIDGITYVSAAAIAAGEADFDLPAGLYIVVVDGQSRRVLVK